jgi:uncharacterized protein (TIGR00255 family)
LTYSMTGYGRGVHNSSKYNITVDIKSVNHRYLDCYFKILKTYSYMEERLRRMITNKVSRGKLDVSINIERISTPENKVELNRALVAAYLAAIQEMKSDYSLQGEIDIQSVISLPEIFTIIQPEEDQEELAEATGMALEQALHALLLMRKAEGEKLVADLLQKLALLREYYLKLTEFAPLVIVNYREKLAKRLQELLPADTELDPNRLTMEVAIFADRSDVSEELVRLDSHLQQFSQTLRLAEPVGRKLDFLIQELNREINTIGSKANDLKIAQIVIDFKTELEKLREQIQNLE